MLLLLLTYLRLRLIELLCLSAQKKELSSYGQVQEHDVASTTSATELMTMLFDKACVLLKTAMRALESNDNQAFHQSALHALQIVLSLRFVLDTDSGSELSQSLFGTYTTIAASLKKAKEEQDAAAIATIYEALDELEPLGILWPNPAFQDHLLTERQGPCSVQ